MTIKNKTIFLSKKDVNNYNHYQLLALEQLAAYSGYNLVIEGR